MPEQQTSDPGEDLAINRFWDDLVGGYDQEPVPLDPALAAVIRDVQQAAGMPPPRVSRERVDREVLAAIDRTGSRQGHEDAMILPKVSAAAPRPIVPNRSILSASPHAKRGCPKTFWRPALVSFASAAIVLIAIAILVAMPQLPWPRERLRNLPAMTGIVPSAEGGIVKETLFDEPNVALPDGHVMVYFARIRLQRDAHMREEGLAGTIVHWIDQGTPTIVLPNGERTLAPGETLITPTRNGFTMRNDGQNEAIVVQARFLDPSTSSGRGHGSFSDPTQGRLDYLIGASVALSAESGEVLVERLTLPVGTVLPPTTVTGLDWFGIGAGRAGVSVAGEQLPFRWDPGEERTFGFGQYLPILSPETEMTLRNAGDDPLVLYRLSVTPGDG